MCCSHISHERATKDTIDRPASILQFDEGEFSTLLTQYASASL